MPDPTHAASRRTYLGRFMAIVAAWVLGGRYDAGTQAVHPVDHVRQRKRRQHRARRTRRRHSHRSHRRHGSRLGNEACLLPGTDLTNVFTQAPAGALIRLCEGAWPGAESTMWTLSRDIMIVGAGSTKTIIGNGAEGSGSFTILRGATVRLAGLTLDGAALFRSSAINNVGDLTLSDVVIRNSADGAITNDGHLLITDGSVLTRNDAELGGGAIQNGGRGIVRITAGCRIVENSTSSTLVPVGGIYSTTGASVHLASADIVTGNFARNCGTDDRTPIKHCDEVI